MNIVKTKAKAASKPVYKIDREFFFATVRKSLFGGSLSTEQVRNLSHVLDTIETYGITNLTWIAYILATPYHEVGRNYRPVREGFASTNQGAINAVTKLYKDGKIKVNYALPDKRTGKSYYGRGFVQETWYDNYLKGEVLTGLPLTKDPDLVLRPEVSAVLMVNGMLTGSYRGKSLADYTKDGRLNYVAARNIINGDTGRKVKGKSYTIGQMIAGYAQKFEAALRWLEPETA